MNRWKIAPILGLLIMLPLAVTACTGSSKKDCPPPAGHVLVAAPPECGFLPPSAPPPSFSPAAVVLGDGLYIVGVDMIPGEYLSDGIPSQYKNCQWFVQPSPDKDPDTQNLPSYTQFKGVNHQIRIVVEQGQGFFTKDCGHWRLMKVILPSSAPKP